MTKLVDQCPHVYLSTACYHNFHGECRQTCKFCPSPCSCECHKEKPSSEVRNPLMEHDKAEYDRKYRKLNKERLRAQKAAHFKRTYDPVLAAIERKTKMPRHIEYCRRPEYVAWKKKYDQKRRLARLGDFKEAYAVLQDLRKEINKQMPDRFERYAQAQRHQWNPINQQRRRRATNQPDSF